MDLKDFRALTTKYSGKANVLTCRISISLPFDPRNGKYATSGLLECNAIWDTGASSSVITKNLAIKLGLKPTGKIEVRNTSGKRVENTYLVNVYLPNKVAIAYLKVVECMELVGDFDFLIGMDVIGMGDFSVTNVDDKTILSYRYPSIKTVDYVEEANNEKVIRLKMAKINKERETRWKHPRLSKRTLKKKRKSERQAKKKSRKK